MKFHRLGNSGLKISTITFGSALTIGTERKDSGYAADLVSRAWDLGIRSFDTSNNYGMGMAESLLGDALRVFPRHEYIVATKGSWPLGEGVYEKGLGRKHLRWAFDCSLSRLGLDYVDIYYAHRFDPETSMEELVRTFNDLIRSGRVLYWATSEWTADQLRDCHRVCDSLGMERPILEQFIYSYAVNKADTNGVIDFCTEMSIGKLGFSPLAQGLLTGKYENVVPAGSRISKSKELGYDKTQKIYDQNKYRVDHFVSKCKEFGIPGNQAALHWVLRRGVLPVLGASNPDQLSQNVNALERPIPDEFWAAVDGV